MRSVVAIVSGGLDSTVMCALLLEQGCGVEAVSFDYGQRHRKELDHARAIAAHYGIKHDVCDLRSVGMLLPSSALLAGCPVPHGHYADVTMKATVVPNRNMIMIAIAAALAIERGADAIAYGAHDGDHAIYPDCREAFAVALDQALALADWHPVQLLRPLRAMTKRDIVRHGARLRVPMHLTWSCYEGGVEHCGVCGTCVERREAFVLAGVEDPTRYA